MIHDIEFRHPAVLKLTMEFLNHRAARNLSSTGRPSRIGLYGGGQAFKDEWESLGGDDYMGRIYPDATEILTMGIERLIKAPKRFAEQDPEYFAFLLRIFQQ